MKIHYSVDTSYNKNAELVPAFYNHDIAHVLFGLSTDVQHESLVDTRVIFGTNWGFKKYANDYFKNPNAVKIFVGNKIDIREEVAKTKSGKEAPIPTTTVFI